MTAPALGQPERFSTPSPVRAPDRRRAAAAVLLAPVVFVVAVSAGGGWAHAPLPWLALVAAAATVGAATLSTYVPRRGERAHDAVGCAPCATFPAMTVAGVVALVASTPHAPGIALVAAMLAVAGFARRRSAAGQSCPTP